MKKLALGALIAAFAACGGSSATPKDTGGDDSGSGTPDAPPACSVFADAGAQGCATGQKCTWIIDDGSADTGHLGCATAGGAGIGSACSFSNAAAHSGFDSCATGGYCIGGTCEQICDNNGTAKTCDSSHSCGTYEGVFGPPGGTDIAGVCDPTCDPLTQNAGSALACGGTLVCFGSGSGCGSDGPSLGCYASLRSGQGTCANTPESRGTVGVEDDAKCTKANGCANSAEAPFLNGCAPGYIPALLDAIGSTFADCNGLCAPADADSTTLAETGNKTALGKLPKDPAPVAGHAVCEPNKKAATNHEECLYSYALTETTAGLPDSPFNDTLGICFDYAKFTYDPTQNGSGSANPIPDVDCNKLRPGEIAQAEAFETNPLGPFAKCSSFATGSERDCFAIEHQCYNSVRSGFGSGSGSAAAAFAGMRRGGVAAHYRLPLSMGTLKFRRAGGIY